MAAINDLIAQIENPELRARIQAEVDRMNKQKRFGLVFEEHLPEFTPLYDIPVKRGVLVALKTGKVSEVYRVLKIKGDEAECKKKEGGETATFKIDELVTVAEFGEPIYPYLKQIGSVCNAPDSDLWHTLIEADNYHALQLLEYLYAGKVDCIYIDPPYNTGARDWKYNNDYVDGADQYRHSKWLSFMQKRLKIAKKLLNPKDSVLIVTIDEKEYLHLGCLLEELFPEASMQMISSEIHHGGTNRKDEFSRINEFIYFLRFGACSIYRDKIEGHHPIPWRSFLRSSWKREQRPNLFYPIYVNTSSGRIVKVGDALPIEQDKSTVEQIEGCMAVFPIDKGSIEGIWRLSSSTVKELLDKGYFKVNIKSEGYSFSYLLEGVINDISTGKITIEGKDEQGCIVGYYSDGREIIPSTQWSKLTHDASQYGAVLLRAFIGDRFTFPKSLYGVHDCINYFVREKKDAIILDFFAGSGTTLHAVNLLNAEDGGHRRCIMVTNNEVSADEAKTLSASGYHPGDEEWEKLGIARYVTWPRTVCSIKGKNIKGEPLKGNYIGSDIPMADGFKANAIYFKLGFLDKNEVALGRQFKEMLPTLWMKAGAIGLCPTVSEDIPDMLIFSENKFAVLIDEMSYMTFEKQISEHPEIETIYIVTDSEPGYREMIAAFEGKNTYQLYRDYLDNFRINTGR